MTRRRLDAELVRRGLARSREHARALIEGGQVRMGGVVAAKPATMVADDAALVVADSAADEAYVSRGAHKLIGALDAFAPQGLSVQDRDALDAGASTGGFTQVLLRRGVRRVAAVDVGYGQLAWPVRTDPRVLVLERTNIRDLGADALPFRPDLVVADLSFISLALVLPALVGCSAPGADMVPMVKPQFEVGRENVGARGVVRDPRLRTQAVRRIADVAWNLGLGTAGVVASPLPGPQGNVEFFLWLVAGAPAPDPDAIARAVEKAPDVPGPGRGHG